MVCLSLGTLRFKAAAALAHLFSPPASGNIGCSSIVKHLSGHCKLHKTVHCVPLEASMHFYFCYFHTTNVAVIRSVAKPFQWLEGTGQRR